MIGQLGQLGQLGGVNSGVITPQSLFTNGEQGIFLYPQDTTSLFQDAAGTIPAVAENDPVGLILDKSKGLVVEERFANHDGTTTNYFSTPDSEASSVTGDITVFWTGKLESVAPSTARMLVTKADGTSSQYSYSFLQAPSDGRLIFTTTVNGSSLRGAPSTVSLASVGITENTRVWLYVTREASTGITKFFYSLNGTTYTQLGANVSTTAGNIFNGTEPLAVGIRVTGGLYPLTGQTYRAQVFAGIGITGTPVVDFNPSLYTSGSTFTASTGEVWTLSGAAQIVPVYAGNHAYQTVSTKRALLKYTDSGVLGLSFDGIDDCYVTNAIDFSDTDEMTVFAGVQKRSAIDGSADIVCELSAAFDNNNGTFAIGAPGSSTEFAYVTKGTSVGRADDTDTAHSAPYTAVITGESKISTDFCRLSIDGGVIESTTLDQGTGNYGNYPLNIGSRNQSSTFFKGFLSALIIRGKAVTQFQKRGIEQWVKSKQR